MAFAFPSFYHLASSHQTGMQLLALLPSARYMLSIPPMFQSPTDVDALSSSTHVHFWQVIFIITVHNLTVVLLIPRITFRVLEHLSPLVATTFDQPTWTQTPNPDPSLLESWSVDPEECPYLPAHHMFAYSAGDIVQDKPFAQHIGTLPSLPGSQQPMLVFALHHIHSFIAIPEAQRAELDHK